GRRAGDMAHRLCQMGEFGVFEEVEAEVQREIEAADAALAPWPGEPPTPLLGELCGVLRSQISALRSRN
ncbi:MAG: polyprenyl synthetase family protein, partial [Cephaloticoccus sp.]